MRQERLLSVGTDGGGYINLLCTNKDDLSLNPLLRHGTMSRSRLAGKAIYFVTRAKILEDSNHR